MATLGDSAALNAPFTKRKVRMSSTLKTYITTAFTEFLGTFLYLFFAFTSAQSILDTTTPETIDPLLQQLYISTSFGISLAFAIFLFTHISGGLFNPALTLAFTLTRLINPIKAVVLVVAELVGGIVAAAVVDGLVDGRLEIGNNGKELVDGKAMVLEALLTMMLVLMVFLVAAEPDHPSAALAPIAIGGTYFLGHMVGATYSGASMNPARSFGPAVVERYFPGFHWVYWVGPFLGAAVAAGIFWGLKVMGVGMGHGKVGREKMVDRESQESV